MVKRILHITLFLFATLTVNFAQDVSILATTDTTDYVVGDYIRYTLEMKYDKSVSINIPSAPDSLKELVFIKKEPVQRAESDNQVIEYHTWVFSKYDSAGVRLPSYIIRFSENGGEEQNYYVNDLSISVHTLDVQPQSDISDVKAPITIPYDWTTLILIILGVLILLTAAWIIYKKYFSKKEADEVKKIKLQIPPHKIALTALSELEEKKLWQQEKIKEYHSEITYIIRKYFEDRFKFPALELTSAEAMEKLQEIDYTGIITGITREFFVNADMVKFAKFKPIPSVNEEMMKQAYDIVRKTKEDDKPAEVENAQ